MISLFYSTTQKNVLRVNIVSFQQGNFPLSHSFYHIITLGNIIINLSSANYFVSGLLFLPGLYSPTGRTASCRFMVDGDINIAVLHFRRFENRHYYVSCSASHFLLTNKIKTFAFYITYITLQQ